MIPSQSASLSQSDLEKSGSAFNTDQMLNVRNMTRDAIHSIAQAIHPGMKEEDAVEMAKDMLAEINMLR
ncbi:MAG: hypothetical protein ABIR84_13250, partial [Candidatus Nitrotoga sp.]